MPPMFSAAYDPGIEKWVGRHVNESGDGLQAVDPLTGEEVQLSHTLYADDAQETNVEGDAERLGEVLAASGEALDAELGVRGMARNTAKEEHLV